MLLAFGSPVAPAAYKLCTITSDVFFLLGVQAG